MGAGEETDQDRAAPDGSTIIERSPGTPELSRNAAKTTGTVLKEKNCLRQWTSTVSLGSPNLLLVYSDIYAHLESQPLCQIDVSSVDNHLAIMSHDRELKILNILDDQLVVKATVKVLAERFPEWCILKWTASGALLISSRSNAILDVFDSSGGYCYSISLENAGSDFDAPKAISHISTIACSSEEAKWLDTLYTLQFNGTFSSFKIGRLAGYFPVFRVEIGQNISTSFVLIPTIDLLIVASQYRIVSAASEESTNCNSIGLGVYRVVRESPYVVDVKVAHNNIGLWDVLRGYLPLCAPQTAVIVSLAANEDFSRLACVSSSGDIYIFALPSVISIKFIRYYGDGEKPVQCIWIYKNELGILTRKGTLLTANADETACDLSQFERKERFSPLAKVVSPHAGAVFALESQVLSTEGNRSLVAGGSSRAWLAAKLRLITFYDYFKVYLGAAVGQPLEDVPEAFEKREVRFSLHEIRSVTLQHMFNKLLAHGDFMGAMDLALKHEFKDLDFIYKSQWKRLGSSVTVAEIDEVLKHVSDKEWIVSECLTSQATEMNVHRALVKLALDLTSESRNPQRAFVLHCDRILKVLGDDTTETANMFIDFRSTSLLDTAIYLAQTLHLEELQRLIENNPEIIKHAFTILWNVPEITEPRKYEFLIPLMRNGWFDFDISRADKSLTELQTDGDDEVKAVVEKLNFATVHQKFSFPNEEDIKSSDVLDYLLERCFNIDEKGGLCDVLVSFLKIAIKHGFNDLEGFLKSAKFYHDYTVMCGSVALSLKQFNSLQCSAIFQHLIKHVTADVLCKNMPRIEGFVEHLYEYGLCASPEIEFRVLLRAFSKSSVQVLTCVFRHYRELCPQSTIIECFRENEQVGIPLIFATCELAVPRKFVKALYLFHNYGFDPTFDQVYSSSSDATLAGQMVYRLIRSANCSSRDDWAELKRDLFKLRSLLYSEVLDERTLLSTFASQMLDLENERKTRELLDLALSYESKNSDDNKLSPSESVDMLIEKSIDFWNMASSCIDDRNLRLAKEVLKLAPEGCSSKLTAHMRHLEALELSQRLGYTLLPVKFRFIEPDQVLSDVVKIDGNYKKAKECAQLALLLGIRLPVSRAVTLCAVEALLVRDEKTLRKYCEQLLKTVKGFPGICSLCIDVIKSKFLEDMEEDLLACALMNCSDDDLFDVMELMTELDKERAKRTPRPNYVEPSEEIVFDPMYTPLEFYHEDSRKSSVIPPEPKNVNVDRCTDEAEFINSIANLARQYTHISATVALNLSMYLPKDCQWTRNEFLMRYSNALREAYEKFPGQKVGLIPPHILLATTSSQPSGCPALERILNSGCDRERFVEDSEYRKDTLVRLAMTTDEQLLEDCVEIAKKYHFDEWLVYMSTVEHVLTDSAVLSKDMTKILSNDELRKTLNSNKPRFHKSLRSTVLSGLSAYPKDRNRIEAYLSLFGSSDPESQSLPALKNLERVFGDIDFPLMLSGVADRIVPLVLPHLKEPTEREIVIASIRLLPNGSEICKNAARSVFSQRNSITDHLIICFELFGEDTVATLHLISTLPLSAEESYIEEALEQGQFDESMQTSRSSLERRLSMIKSRRPLSPASPNANTFDTPSPTVMRRRHH